MQDPTHTTTPKILLFATLHFHVHVQLSYILNLPPRSLHEIKLEAFGA